MQAFAWLMTGGFVKGYRTYILSGVTVVSALAAWSVGDLSGMAAFTAVSGALGLNAAANH